MNIIIIAILSVLFSMLAIVFLLLKSRNMHLWMLSYIKECFNKVASTNKKKHIYFCLVDHYEPYYKKVTQATARNLVKDWLANYREIACKHQDSDGQHPKHSYFYPIEEYDETILDDLKDICQQGYGDVDIHLHHDNDNEHNLRKTLLDFKELLYTRHSLLRKDDQGNIVYGFIHGNWALDNSRPDGRWCGVDNEIDVLLQTGCVFDMTMPSAPSDTQTSTINQIYFAREDGKCKSHDTGIAAKVGNWMSDRLLMIQGPLTLNWKRRKFGLIPRIESSELSYDAPPAADRLILWEQCGICLKGAENHIFIKLHTHGLQPQNSKMFFENNGLDNLWSMLESRYTSNDNYSLHYVSAWEMYQQIKNLSCHHSE